MATWDTADLLLRVKDKANRPAVDESMSTAGTTDDAKWYRLMTESESRVLKLMSVHAPSYNYGDPVLLVSTDGGETYPFATDVEPMGLVEIRASRNGQLLRLGPEWESGVDITQEGQKLRIPGGRNRTFADGPYARYMEDTKGIASGTDPTLLPKTSRILIVWDTVKRWALMPGVMVNPEKFEKEFQFAAWGDPGSPGDVGIIGALKKQFLFQGAGATPAGDTSYWWRGIDTGSGYPTIN